MDLEQPVLPAAALWPGDELVGWLDDWTDVPLRVVEVGETRLTVVTASAAVGADETVHLGVRRGLRLALTFTVAARRSAGGGAAVEVLELELLRSVDLSARRHERRDEGGRPVRLAASRTDVRPATPVRLLDRSASGLRFGGADGLQPGDHAVLRDGDQQLDIVIVRREPRPFGRAEYGCALVAGDATAAAAV